VSNSIAYIRGLHRNGDGGNTTVTMGKLR